MPSCVVKCCRNHSRVVNKQQGITFHQFPGDEVWRSDWVSIIRESRKEKNWNPAKYSAACSVHFDAKDLYTTKSGLRRVVKFAVPKKNVAYTGVPTREYDNGRDEKPWQRVMDTMTKKGKHLYEPVVSVPSTVIIVLLGWYLLLGYLTQLVEDDMPKALNESDIARDNTEIFSEETAWRYLYKILGDGPRVAGTPYHYNKTVDVKAMVDQLASTANRHVLTDWQVVSGNFSLGSSAPFLTVYQNVSNVIAVLVGETGLHANGSLGTSLLVNCHYDSVPFAMGASDNAVFCAVMMEILGKMSRRTRTLRNNIVFLFNGAEEMGLLASHGFLQHPWAAGVTTVINLDAAGMNGKPAVFQVNDPRLLNAYRRAVTRPNAQGLGEFLFASGLVPSDTDFRIFRDYGQIYGIDIAFTKWGHVYHTRYDHPDNIQDGVIQNAGNTLMALIDELGGMDALDHKIDPPTPAVYYDFLNSFMITYSLTAAYVVDALVLLFAATSVFYYVWLVGPRSSTVQELLWSVLGRVAAMLAGVVATLIPVSIMIATTTQLRYLSHAWIVVPLFWVPYLVGALAASEAYDAWRVKKSGLNRSIRTLQAQTATRVCLTCTLAVTMCVPSLQYTRYLFTAPLFLLTLMSFVSLTIIRYLRLQAWQHLLLEIVLSTPTVMFMLTLALRLDAMMLPIMGRTPTTNPDYTVAFLNIALAALVATTVSGIELLFSRRRIWLPLGLLYVACVIIMFIPMSPYSDDGPATQRHYWLHTQITTYNAAQEPTERRTGVTVLRMDAYTTTRLEPLITRYTHTTKHACDDRVYCDLPLYRTSFSRYLPEATFIDMEGPSAFSPPAALGAARSCVGDTCVYNFTVTGDLHNTLTIWPRPSVNVTAWSFTSPPSPALVQLDRPVYTIVHSLGTYRGAIAPWSFTVTVTIPLAQQSQIALDVSHHSHKIQHPEDFTPAYRTLLDSAPKYFNVATMISFRNNYVF